MRNEVKVGINAERQKFRLPKKKEKKALDFFDKKDIENYSGFIGTKLTLGENKALFAIYKMLNAKKPKVNKDAKLSDFATRLPFKSKAEYFDAYGVGKRKTSRGWMEYNVGESKKAMRDLFGLTKSNCLYYERTYWKKNKQGKEKKLTDVIAFVGSLIRVVIEGKGLDEEEIMKFKKNNLTPEEFDRLFTYELDIASILIDQWKSHFILIPDTLFDDIKKISDGKQSKYYPLFIEWLILQAEFKRRNKDVKNKISIHWRKLARTLRMDALIKKREKTKIKEMLQQCYEIAHRLGYLSNAVTNEEVHKLTLNTEQYPYYAEEIKRTQELWHKKEYKRKKLIEKRLKFVEKSPQSLRGTLSI